jgi:hypothetical protein
MDSTETLILILSIAIQANVPIMLWGDIGVAKTAMIQALGRALGWPVVTKIAAIHDPTDFGGYPMPTPTGTRLEPMQWVYALSEAVIGKARCILFLDEANHAARSTQQALMQLVHERRVGEGMLGPGVARVAAANPTGSGGDVFIAGLANRFFHLKWVLSVQYWCDGMMGGFQDPVVALLPDGWESGIPQARLEIAAYVSRHADVHHARPDNEDEAGRAWPSPRSWDMAATMMAAGAALNVNDGIMSRLVEGCVGAAAAATFMEYKRKLNLPDPEEALKSPKKIKMPKRGDQVYAFLNSVVSAVQGNNTEKRWHAGWEVMSIASVEMKDVAASAARRLANLPHKGYGPALAAGDFYDAMQLAGIATARIKTPA